MLADRVGEDSLGIPERGEDLAELRGIRFLGQYVALQDFQG